jgi:hypothetical protein
LAVTRSQITRRDDDRELQTVQTIVGLPARKLQPPAWSATAARSVFGASRQLPDRLGEGPLTEPTADTRACRWELVKMSQFGHFGSLAEIDHDEAMAVVLDLMQVVVPRPSSMDGVG